jgi:hypothetical protein
LGVYLLLRRSRRFHSRFARVLVPAAAVIVVVCGVWYALVAASSGGVCPLVAWKADSTSDAPLPEAAQPALADSLANADQAEPGVEARGPQVKVIAYYFHRTVRCHTCLAIEEEAHEAIENGFFDELEAGRLEWRAVNIEEPGNEHFETDFGLESQSLVLVGVRGETVQRWEILPRVWELVEDPYGFQEYVWAEVMEFLGM